MDGWNHWCPTGCLLDLDDGGERRVGSPQPVGYRLCASAIKSCPGRSRLFRENEKQAKRGSPARSRSASCAWSLGWRSLLFQARMPTSSRSTAKSASVLGDSSSSISAGRWRRMTLTAPISPAPVAMLLASRARRCPPLVSTWRTRLRFAVARNVLRGRGRGHPHTRAAAHADVARNLPKSLGGERVASTCGKMERRRNRLHRSPD